MGIRPLFTNAQVDLMMQEALRRVQLAIFNLFAYVGEKCVNEARDFGGYEDQTGALRSSVGYIVLVDGVILNENFKITERPIKKKQDMKALGLSTARTFAQQMAAKYNKGFVLVVVAGMNYAAYVEARGYNVLSSAENLARLQLPAMLEKLKRKVEA